MTVVEISLPESADVRFKVYDLRGREVARLVDRRLMAGFQRFSWNGKTMDGLEVSIGIYIGRLVTPQYTKSIKMVLLK